MEKGIWYLFENTSGEILRTNIKIVSEQGECLIYTLEQPKTVESSGYFDTTGTSTKTPGFELCFFIYAITYAIALWKKKKKDG